RPSSFQGGAHEDLPPGYPAASRLDTLEIGSLYFISSTRRASAWGRAGLSRGEPEERSMPEIVEGALLARGLRFALVASRFNEAVATRLIDGAVDALLRHGALDKDIRIVRVPGSFEIPMVARRLAASKKFSAVVCLGALVRGATP